MVVENLREAINNHDLDAFVACFDVAYRRPTAVNSRLIRLANSAAATKSERTGRRSFRRSLIFRLPASRVDPLELTEWGEWRRHGTRANGDHFEMRGVTLMGTRNNHIVWGRLYMEEVEEAGEEIDHAVQRLAGGDTGQAEAN